MVGACGDPLGDTADLVRGQTDSELYFALITKEIERDGDTVATVKKALVHVVRDRFSFEVDGGEDLEAKGNIVDHEYKVERDGDHVAEISKRWFRVRDTYGIQIAPGQDDALILAAVVCIDQMSHD